MIKYFIKQTRLVNDDAVAKMFILMLILVVIVLLCYVIHDIIFNEHDW